MMIELELAQTAGLQWLDAEGQSLATAEEALEAGTPKQVFAPPGARMLRLTYARPAPRGPEAAVEDRLVESE